MGALAFFVQDRIKVLHELKAQHGDISMSRLGKMKVYFISNPDAVQDVLVSKQRMRLTLYILAKALFGSKMKLDPRVTLRPKRGLSMVAVER